MRLIDADELLSLYEGEDENLRASLRVIKENIKDAPTIEAEPIKHGRWRVEPQGRAWVIIYCSECGEGMWNRRDQQFPNYCHNCGAKMDD